MCYNCGCGNAHDDMGDPDNLTQETFINLSNAMGQELDTIKNLVYSNLEKQENSNFKDLTGEDVVITDLFSRAAKAWGQTEAEARKYTYKLLQHEMKKKGS